MDALARREHGFAELERKMRNAGFDAATAATTLTALATEGLQDDRRFAEAFIASGARRGKGPVRLRHDLEQRGVAPAVVDGSMETLNEDWRTRAREVRAHKFGPERPGSFPEQARQMRFLQYRGFASEHIAGAFDAADD